MGLREEIDKLLKKYPDPRRENQGVLEFTKKRYYASCPPVMGIVADKKDPDCLGPPPHSDGHALDSKNDTFFSSLF